MKVKKWAALLPVWVMICGALISARPLTDDQHANVPRISVDELLLAVLKKKPVTIIDVRSLDAYTTKIPGALQIPVDEVEARLKEIPRNREIVTYCA